ncbi:type II secretion system F family protein [Telmatospirillum siberiense]|uniref:Type II secretion system F family protein n=1 Tax=Telmatospirillum siberiense TaxID=382514 RepID=A0A2N3PQC7_9PROT|nr:type II secretion system F family protein [Telmatospirillum siberiense]PKU22600.1 type II secretion system F family protein [Telmatospirillum siberiense]
MPVFRYLAIDPAGLVQRGTMEAADGAAVADSLQRRGLTPMRTDPAGAGGFFGELVATEFSWRRDALSHQDVAIITRELSTMLEAGQDLDRALRFIVETAANARIRIVMDRVRSKVRGGGALAAALALEGRSFSRLYIGMVRAGEAGGTLSATLDHLAALLERERALSASIQSAMIYPALLLVAAAGTITLLLTSVLPQFAPLFAQNGAEMPAATRTMMAMGDFLSVAGPWMLIGFLIIGLAARQALKDPAIRLPVDRILLRLPVAGLLFRHTLAARFSRTLGTLLKNGVPLVATLSIVKDALGNLAAVAAVERAAAAAKGGGGLTQTLAESHIFPPRAIHLLRLGEETAQLAKMALKAADIHQEEAHRTVERLVALLVPAITVAMGGAVAAIVGSLLLAMLSLNDLAH